MGDNITEGTIVDLPVPPGDFPCTATTLRSSWRLIKCRWMSKFPRTEYVWRSWEKCDVGSNLYRLDTDAVPLDEFASPSTQVTAPPKEEDQSASPPPPLPPSQQAPPISAASVPIFLGWNEVPKCLPCSNALPLVSRTFCRQGDMHSQSLNDCEGVQRTSLVLHAFSVQDDRKATLIGDSGAILHVIRTISQYEPDEYIQLHGCVLLARMAEFEKCRAAMRWNLEMPVLS
jgi:hypothetical protein